MNEDLMGSLKNLLSTEQIARMSSSTRCALAHLPPSVRTRTHAPTRTLPSVLCTSGTARALASARTRTHYVHTSVFRRDGHWVSLSARSHMYPLMRAALALRGTASACPLACARTLTPTMWRPHGHKRFDCHWVPCGTRLHARARPLFAGACAPTRT
jgi:hypothetical protein